MLHIAACKQASFWATLVAAIAAVTLAGVDGRPVITKAIDGVAWLFSPYL